MNDTAQLARQAAGRLADRLETHPAVVMVDVGRGEGRGEITIRVHVRSSDSASHRPDVPSEYDGFAVVTIPVEYRLETEP